MGKILRSIKRWDYVLVVIGMDLFILWMCQMLEGLSYPEISLLARLMLLVSALMITLVAIVEAFHDLRVEVEWKK